MDTSPEKQSFWTRLIRHLFGHVNILEKAIEEAKEEGEIKDDEETMLMGILELRSLSIEDIMTPRSQVEAVSHMATLSELASFIKETGYSRVPVFKETKDHIVGIVYARDIVHPLLTAKEHTIPAIQYAKEAFFTTTTTTVQSLLSEFKRRRCHIAVVLDEYGGTAGIVTVADILEPVFGKLDDEYDETLPEEEIQQITETTFIVPGKMPLDELASINVILDSDEVDTIGGYLANIIGGIPSAGEHFTIEDIVYTVIASDKKQIQSIQIVLPSKQEIEHK